MGAALKGRNEVVQLLVDRGAKLDTRDHGSRDTDNGRLEDRRRTPGRRSTTPTVSCASACSRRSHRPETAALIRKLMTERGMPVPPANRIVDSICVVSICQERQPTVAKP